MEQLKDLNARIQNPEEGDDTHQLRHQMRTEMGEVGELLQAERGIIIEQFAKDLGYGEENAADFARHIDQIYENTSVRSIMGWGRRGRR